jgi:hypothetical protein
MKGPSEHDEQFVIFEWARWNHSTMPELKLMFAVPNGGKRHIGVARKMKAEGVKAGVPDIVLPVARKGFHGLFIELKRDSIRPKRGGSGGVSPVQREWLDALQVQGYRVEVCYGAREAMKIIEGYLK